MSIMKKHILISLLSILFVCSLLNAQTQIDDPNFEQALIDLGIDSGVINGSVPTANISDITFLDVSKKNISFLDGIEDFSSLENLICFGNNLSTIDVSNLTNLKSLLCGSNFLTTLSVNSNSNLETLNCSDNQIQDLDLTSNKALKSLSCSGNQISQLDLSSNGNLNFLSVSNNRLSGELVVGNNTSLESLFCASNHISILDLSSNTVLKNLDATNNLLTTLDLSNINTDVCPDPQIDPVTLCQGFSIINVSINQLASINIANGYNNLITSFNSEGNPDLFCIQIDNGSIPNSSWEKDDWIYWRCGMV